MLKEGLEEKMNIFSRLETEFQSLIKFIAPNEAGRIKARLMQIERYREEFKNSVEQREAELHSSLRNTKQFTQDLNEVTLYTWLSVLLRFDILFKRCWMCVIQCFHAS